jgi:hypothetical protein
MRSAVMSELKDAPPPDRVGLCRTCVHGQTVTSSKGSTFYLCRLSETDPRFRRYPALPVLACTGYRPRS